MKKLFDYECEKGHQFEQLANWDEDEVRCIKCRGNRMAERIWLSRRSGYRHMQNPIYVDRLPDGSYSFPGSKDSRPPEGAERVELRTFAEYRQEMKKINNSERNKAEREREALHERHEIILNAYRDEARRVLANLDDNWGKDLIREALAAYNSDMPASRFGEIWCEAMEN